MRFGWLAAAAAMVFVAPASAQTWVKYEIAGAGYQRSTDGSGIFNGPEIAKDVWASFTVLVSPTGSFTTPPIAPPGSTYTTDGSRFTATSQFITFSADGLRSGVLTAQQNNPVNGGGGGSGSLTVNYPDADGVGGFPVFFGTFAASGGVGYQQFASGNGSGTNIFGSISRLTISTASGFQPLLVTAVPEPASWAMMIIGVGAVGGTLRRRKTTIQLA